MKLTQLMHRNIISINSPLELSLDDEESELLELDESELESELESLPSVISGIGAGTF